MVLGRRTLLYTSAGSENLLKRVKPSWVLLPLVLAACAGQPAPPGPVQEIGNFADLARFDRGSHGQRVPPVQRASYFDRSAYSGPLGIDLAMDTSNVVEELRGGRIDFVARYYRDSTSSLPALSSQEARKLASLGLKIVAVWEQNSPDPENLSYSSGYGDALAAYKQAKAIGQPPGSAIYFAIDYNAHELEPAKAYFRGIAAGLAAASGGRPEYKIGVYGSGAVCTEIKRAGLARYSWLTKATSWDGSLDYSDWNIKQGAALPFSFDNDSDQARGDYGAFRLRNS